MQIVRNAPLLTPCGAYERPQLRLEQGFLSVTSLQQHDERDGEHAPGVVKPAGEWNSSRIVARGPHVEHWLNGKKVVEYELWSPDWEAKVKASKFKDWPNYGRAKKGYIAIQGDHEGSLSLRNVRIRELK